MKKLLVLFAFICFGLNGFSQVSTLPNGGFESWTQKPNWGYYEPDGGFFHTLNILDTVPTSAGISVYRCSDTVHSGSFSARCITRLMKIVQLNVTIPGVIGSLKINWSNSTAILGEKYTWTAKPERFQGYYQSYPLNGDTTAAILLLSKWNTGTHHRDTIAYNRLVFKGIVNTWTLFDTPVTYFDNTTMPDSITVLLLSCAGYNAQYMMGSVGQIGSQAYFDDVTLTNIAGIEYIFHPTIDVKISPNPASSYINVSLDKAVKDGSFEIYDVQGKKSGQFEMSDISARINLSNLASGVYYYRFRGNGEVMNTGSFIVTR
jgi:hypothetical protein